MLNLVQNENMKIYRRLRTWILVGILIALMVTVSLIVKNMENKIGGGGDWRKESERIVADSKQMLSENSSLPGFAKESVEREMLLHEYRLQHNIPPADDTVWGSVLNMSSLIVIVTIFTVVIAADIVAGEFSTGTIKLLLIRPASRTKILFSKYISTILFSLFLLVLLFASSFILNGFLYGFSNVGTPYLYMSKDLVVHERSMFIHAINTYALKTIELVMVVTLAFMISTVFRSSSLAISIALLLLFLGQGITNFFSQWSWGKYWLFANTNLTQYIEGRPFMEGMTMTFSIIVLFVYFVVINGLTWTIFKRRDVAA